MSNSRLALVLLATAFASLCAQASAAGTPPPAAPAPASAPVAVPPALTALEQKMLALQISSERISGSVSVSGSLGAPAGPFGSFGKPIHVGNPVDVGKAGHGSGNAAARAAASFPLISISGEQAFAPPAANLEVSVFGIKVAERLIGETLYVKEPFIARSDGGRPWVAKPNQHFAQATSPELSTLGGQPGSGSEQAFGSLIESLAAARSISELGPATVDGQAVTVFRASVPIATTAKRSAKELRALAKTIRPLAQLEIFIAENGLPVRSLSKLTLRGAQKAELITQTDILATNVPVVVVPPPADQTISEAQYKRLLARELRRLVARSQRRKR